MFVSVIYEIITLFPYGLLDSFLRKYSLFINIAIKRMKETRKTSRKTTLYVLNLSLDTLNCRTLIGLKF